MSPVKQKAAVAYVLEQHQVTERRACRVLKVNRTAWRYEPVRLPDEDEVRASVVYVGGIGHPGAESLDSRGGEIGHLRRQDWTVPPQALHRHLGLFGNAFAFPHGIFAADDDAIGVVDNAVTDGISEGRLTNLLVPASNVKLRAEYG